MVAASTDCPGGYTAMLTDYISPNQDFIACPNQDVVYGGGFSALEKEPMVIQVPDFGDASGSMRYMTSARTKLAGLASNTAASRAST